MVNFFLVRSCIQRVFPHRTKKTKIAVATIGIAFVVMATLFSFSGFNLFKFPVFFKTETVQNQVALPGNWKIASTKKPRPLTDLKKAKGSSIAEETLKDSWPKSAGRETSKTIEPQSPDKTQPKKSKLLPTSQGFPEILGKIKLRPNQTLSGLIQTIYGSYNSKHFKSLILANPHIDDPDIVDIGQSVTLPAIPANLKPLSQKVWWIKISDRNNLKEAFKLLETFPKSEPEIRLIPYWNSHTGIKFSVVLKKFFLNEEAAQIQLKELPLSISSEGEIISSWDVNNVFFADPFLAAALK